MMMMIMVVVVVVLLMTTTMMIFHSFCHSILNDIILQIYNLYHRMQKSVGRGSDSNQVSVSTPGMGSYSRAKRAIRLCFMWKIGWIHVPAKGSYILCLCHLETQ